MEFLSQEGRFWLPRQPERTVHGLVAFQADGVTLNLEGALHAPDPGGSGGGPVIASEPIIHGYLRDGRQVTLYQASRLTWPVEGIEETWQAQRPSATRRKYSSALEWKGAAITPLFTSTSGPCAARILSYVV